MARKKEPPKPLLAVKHDFVDALDNAIGKMMVLHQMVTTALELKAVDAKIADKMKAAADDFEKAFLSQ